MSNTIARHVFLFPEFIITLIILFVSFTSFNQTKLERTYKINEL